MNCHRLARAAKAISAATSLAALRSGVEMASTNSQIARIRSSVRHASPNSNLRLKPMFFHAPVKRSAAQSQFPGRKRDVEMMHPERPLDHLPLQLVEVKAPGIHHEGGAFRP